MAEEELIPALHDIGKLLDNETLAAQIPGWPQEHGGHTFTDSRDEPIDLAAFSLPQPSGPTWYGIVNHHERIPRRAQMTDANVRAWQGRADVQALAPQLILLMAADHLAASTSRVVAQDSGGRGDPWPQLKSPSRWRLWRDTRSSSPVPLLTTRNELAVLLGMLREQPLDVHQFRLRYATYLKEAPEEKGFPRAVTTLETHLDLVTCYYRVLRRFSDMRRRPGGRQELAYANEGGLSCADVEARWRFRLAHCHIHLPAAPARLHDLGVFARLEAALDQIQSDPDLRDHVLLGTFQDLWLFLPLDSEGKDVLAEVLHPLLEGGFHVEARVREAPLTNLTAWDSQAHDASVTKRYLQLNPPRTIAPPLCEVCQLAPGTPYQERPDDPVEHLCRMCAETREQYAQRFTRLGAWSDEGYAAWLRVFLDFDALEQHLHSLFREYVVEKGKGLVAPQVQDEFVTNLRTTALTVDYVRDFLALQEDLADQLRAVFTDGSVEILTAQRKEVMVVRLERRSDVFRLLQVCDTVARRHFPRSVSQPPFRFAVSLGPVRFPFGEHWRMLQEARAEVTVCLAGGGRLACRLDVIPDLLAVARDRGAAPRRGLHRLAALAAQSPALAQVALWDREDRDLAGIDSRLQGLGLDFASMATFARLTRD